MYDSGTEGDLILWLIHYYLTLDHEIPDKSPARFHLKTPPPSVVWHSTCRFYAFNNFSNMASHLQDLWAIWKLHHLQFLHQGLPPAVFEKSTTCRLFCLQQFLHQGVPSSLSKFCLPSKSSATCSFENSTTCRFSATCSCANGEISLYAAGRACS